MKRVKKGVLILVFMVGVLLVIVGCGSQQAAPTPAAPAPAPAVTPAPAPAATPTAAPKASYVGLQVCAGCHQEDAQEKMFPSTSHNKEFKQLKDYKISNPDVLKSLKVADSLNTAAEVTATLDLTAAALGVYMDQFIVAATPAGFTKTDTTGKFYRVAGLTKKGDSYEVTALATSKNDPKLWEAEDATSCIKCHAPGLFSSAKDPGFSCETCHGPGSLHVSAPPAEKASTIKSGNAAAAACLTCHTTNPSQDAKTGVVTTNNHYGTRDYFASTHAGTKYQISCLTCHGPHKPNANGKLLREANPNDICMKCHADKKYDVAKIMWKNPTDAHEHITADHSFGAMPYEKLGDDKNTPAIEITNQAMLDIIKSKLPDVIKK